MWKSAIRNYTLKLQRRFNHSYRHICLHACEQKANRLRTNFSFYSWLMPRTRVVLRKQRVAQPAKTILDLYCSRSFITLFTRARLWYLVRVKWIQSIHSLAFFEIRFNIMFQPFIILGGHFPSCFPSKILCASLKYPCVLQVHYISFSLIRPR